MLAPALPLVLFPVRDHTSKLVATRDADSLQLSSERTVLGSREKSIELVLRLVFSRLYRFDGHDATDERALEGERGDRNPQR